MAQDGRTEGKWAFKVVGWVGKGHGGEGTGRRRGDGNGNGTGKEKKEKGKRTGRDAHLRESAGNGGGKRIVLRQ